MEMFIDYLLKVIAIVCLFVVIVFLVSLLIEYIRFMWVRHKQRKAFKKAGVKFKLELDKLKEELEKELAEEKTKPQPKKRGRKPKQKSE